ncbi:pyrimidine 5'-nucleotidase [Pasteurella skyensis]|uniref:Pyrimidine 5'-nucleotidase n=1 Tax=Phocoenobacter skyensis TaxID=97481 RepID=A0AAJ6N8Y7_9PAST|nr:pyrimidine 5'-nucleotidase [Pasteurella skyensis]MDP8162439.1 pyrimidine 5'-nucleotidase [Pasteurella skyensis]MDP8172404.1 pyrimidine 5'-nucleotidase [Pasteurella skyensis]MDP8177429.1 pyrimidine 5'-nucleotidase [Pasteurella skyensis]MDP8178659.1 pyrimidine 5'-nucleotidase [Pasteurella skyensis]MDP8183051.1 pyrimidine 5'-nucleotidase [Pasteurella skyensis]
MKYKWILFDADETLFSFNSYLGLSRVLERYDIDFTKQDYEAFQAINKPLWVAYQNKEIQAQDIQTRRFEALSKQTGQPALQLNKELMNEMAKVSVPLPNVESMLNHFYGKVKMGIVTNGFTQLQETRLTNTNTKHFFDLLVVSEEVGTPKPDVKIFDYTLSKIGKIDHSDVLMVGDTLASDILGGHNAGFDTCWFNPHNHINDTQIKPTYEINDMLHLIDIVK